MKFLVFLISFAVCINAQATNFHVADGTYGNELLYKALKVKEKVENEDKTRFSKSGDNFKCQKYVHKAQKTFNTYTCDFKVESVGFKKGFIVRGVENKHHIGLGKELAKELYTKTNNKNLKKSSYTDIHYTRKMYGVFELLETRYENNSIPTYYTFSIKLDVKI